MAIVQKNSPWGCLGFCIFVGLLGGACADTTATVPRAAGVPAQETTAAAPAAQTATASSAPPKAAGSPAPDAKVVSVRIMDVSEAPKTSARIGDTLEVSVPLWVGTDWSVVGEQPTRSEHLERWLGPQTHGTKFVWKITGAPGVRTIKLVSTNLNDAKAPKDEVIVTVTVQ